LLSEAGIIADTDFGLSLKESKHALPQERQKEEKAQITLI